MQRLTVPYTQRALDCCLLYTSDAADERSSVDLGGRRIIKKKKNMTREWWQVPNRKAYQNNHQSARETSDTTTHADIYDTKERTKKKQQKLLQ